MNLQEQVKLRSEQMQQIYDKLNKGLLKDCLINNDYTISIKTYLTVIIIINEDGTFNNDLAGLCRRIEKSEKVFNKIGDNLTFEEIMDSIIVPTEFDAEEFKKTLVNKYDWCELWNNTVKFTSNYYEDNRIRSSYNIINPQNKFHARWNNGLIDDTIVGFGGTELDYYTAKECEKMFELIDEALNKKWTLDWAKQQIVEQFEWLKLVDNFF